MIVIASTRIEGVTEPLDLAAAAIEPTIESSAGLPSHSANCHLDLIDRTIFGGRSSEISLKYVKFFLKIVK
jgi:hypothetical protein